MYKTKTKTNLNNFSIHDDVRNSFLCHPTINNAIFNLINKLFIQPILQKPVHNRLFSVSRNDFIDKDEVQRDQKYIYPVKIPLDAELDSETSNAPWISTFQGYRRAMRWLKSPSDMITQYACWVGFEPKPLISLLDYPLSLVLPLFKKIKIWCHQHYDEYGAGVRYFVDLDSISGIPPMTLRTMGDDPYRWLTELVPSQYDQNFWFDQFKQTFCDMALIREPERIVSLKDFTISRWMWVTDGATKFSKLMLNDSIVKTKFGAAVSLSDDELWSLVLDAIRGNQDIGVFIKGDEASFKRRLIANVPLGGYIIAAYIRYLIESYLGKMPAFEKLAPSFQDKVDVITLLRQKRLCYPLDESAYDYHVTRESWLGFIHFLEYAFPGNLGVQYFKQYFEVAMWSFDGQKGKWLKGMPSGLALTTMVNSWMNYIKQKTIVLSNFHWACGDDVLTFPYDQNLTLAEVEEAYKKFGSEANASKNWSSYKFGEYLKTIYGVQGTSGYPARIFGSLLYTQDLSFRRPDEKLFELVDLWKQLFDRLGLHMDENLVCRDLANAVSIKVRGFNSKLAADWLHSPKIHGGFGKLPYSNKTFSWSIEERYETNYSFNRYRLPRVVNYHGQVELHVGTWKLTTNSYSNGPPYHLPPIDTPEDWERRLNREDLPDRGPYTSMVLDVIPLPVIDFVSVANMSMLAKENQFNVYPNLRGSWNNIASKLINASFALVQYTAHLMDDNSIRMLV